MHAAPTSIAPANSAPSSRATIGAAFGLISSAAIVATSTMSISLGCAPACSSAAWPACVA